MRRLRIVFALLALALAAAAALLLQRAEKAAQAETEARRRTVAERVFDEMERALTEELAKLEARPWSAWLEPAPDEPPFVEARFVLGADGAVRLGPEAPPALAEALARWADRSELASDAEAKATAKDTRALEPGAQAAAVAPEPEAEQGSVYELLQSLNRAAEGRAQRTRKLEVAEAAPPPRPSPAADAAEVDLDESIATADAAPSRADDARRAPRREAVFAQRVRVAVDPLLGRRLDDGRLLLVRTVLVGERGERQGLVLDAGVLADWVAARGPGPYALADGSLAVTTAPGEAAPDGAFVHRFAEPFGALEARLVLPPLPGDPAAEAVRWLALALVAAGALGLFALYRMVSVTWAFAERRSNFVAAVSHELKTPLTAIRMHAEMLRDALVPDERKRQEYYRILTAEAERLSRLIDNVLEFARLERGARPLALRVGDLGGEVASLCEILRPQARGAGFTLECDVEPDLPPVRFERDALAQILVNLVDNALKYGAGTDRTVRIACGREDDGVVLSVRDHGPGLAERQLRHAFEPFWRGQDELTRTTRGTGLGLALVRSLASRMGVGVAGRNAQGGGFEVRLSFPPAEA